MGMTNSDSLNCFKCFTLLEKYKGKVKQQADYIRQLEEKIKDLLEGT
jgi:hypothetical protein